MTDHNYEERRRAQKRQALPGFPWDGKFSSMDEVKQYFAETRTQCLLCGKRYRGIAYHVKAHGITIEEYKERFGIPWEQPTCCPETHAQKSQFSKELSAARAEEMKEVLAEARKLPRRIRKAPEAVSKQRLESLNGERNGLVTSIKTVKSKAWQALNAQRTEEYAVARSYWFWKRDPMPFLAYAEKWGADLHLLPKLLAARDSMVAGKAEEQAA